MDQSSKHSCDSCKGTGKVAGQRTGLRRGVKRTVEFLVDCPAKLTEQYSLGFADTDADKKPPLR